jgi:hypothetical protein
VSAYLPSITFAAVFLVTLVAFNTCFEIVESAFKHSWWMNRLENWWKEKHWCRRVEIEMRVGGVASVRLRDSSGSFETQTLAAGDSLFEAIQNALDKFEKREWKVAE